MEDQRQTLVVLPSGTIDVVLYDGVYMTLQFNASCADALPYCKGMCCRLQHGYSVLLQPDEVGRFRSRVHPKFPDRHIIAAKEERQTCYYQDDESGLCTLHRDGGPEAKPWACGQWHCSPGGKNSDGTVPPVRDQGWFMVPAHGRLGEFELIRNGGAA